jgi:hypothetical protein
MKEVPQNQSIQSLIEVFLKIFGEGKEEKLGTIVAKGVLPERGCHFDKAWGKHRKEIEDED